MSRILVASLLIAGVLLAPSTTRPVGPDAEEGSESQCPELSLETTFLCVALTFTFSSAAKHEFVVVDWGDGTSDWPDCVGGGQPCSGQVPHTYADAASYTIKVTALTYCSGSISTVVASLSASPEFGLYAKSAGDGSIQPATSDPLDIPKLRTSAMDWGDGTSIEEFEWVDDGTGVLYAPRHHYASPGEYTVIARVEYLDAWGGSCYERVGTFDIVIGNSTPVRNATWGAVKALFE
ncbi:MAG: hypothetical protein Q8Q52_02235 [Acidimicrobiia bacterium]|nr:hypothetical protein [Acidimicrobiia bacterium]